MLLLTLLALLAVTARSERISGLYVDNGYDQTIVHRVLTNGHQREVEHELLNLLELPEPPKHRGAFRVKHSASKFLLDIYKNVVEGKSYRYSDSDFHKQTIDQSDTIMTFAAQNYDQVVVDRYEQGQGLWFDVSKVPGNKLILSAELKLYHSLNTVNTTKNRGPFILTAYRVLKLEYGKKKLQYIDSVKVNNMHEGWVILNVSEALHYWLQNPSRNQGLYLSVHPTDRHIQEIRPEDIGFVGLTNNGEQQSFMVTFFKSSDLKEKSIKLKRETKHIKRSSYISFDFRNNPYIQPQMPRWSQRVCQMRTLYVSFRDLKWQDWIIAPEGYDAYYCSGECNFPLNAHMNATNHAIVQSFVHLRFPGKVPKPCCAPTQLSSLSVIYYVDENNIVLKRYKDMVVKNCGCH